MARLPTWTSEDWPTVQVKIAHLTDAPAGRLGYTISMCLSRDDRSFLDAAGFQEGVGRNEVISRQ